MSWKASAWAKTVKAGNPAAKAVLLCLADYADENHTCWPAQETLADESEQSVRSVRRHLEHMESDGLLRRVPRYDKRGYRTSDRYVLAVDGHFPPTGTSDRQENRPVRTRTYRTDETRLPDNTPSAYRTPVSG